MKLKWMHPFSLTDGLEEREKKQKRKNYDGEYINECVKQNVDATTKYCYAPPKIQPQNCDKYVGVHVRVRCVLLSRRGREGK